MNKAQLKKLKKDIERMNDTIADVQTDKAYENSFVLSLLYLHDITTKEKAQELCIREKLHSYTDVLNYLCKDLYNS